MDDLKRGRGTGFCLCVDGDPPLLCEGCRDKSLLRREMGHYSEFCDHCRELTQEEIEDADMGWERYVLGCDGKAGCKRFIVGELATFGNGHFRHPVIGDTDLRNFGWQCYQHRV